MKIRRSLVAAFAVIAIGGWTAARAQPDVTAEELLGGRALGATADPSTPIPSSSVLALSDEMKAFLRQHVNRGAGESVKLQQLIDALMGPGGFHLEYDEDTRTASETFRLRHGNCLSFTTMFVALARAVDLDADFQEVHIPPDWSTRKDVLVLNLHVNVVVDLAFGGRRAVDFNIGDFKSTFDVDVIPDRRAIAHFFNNVGVERMQEREIPEAFAFFRQAILETDGDFSPAWTNLGLLYLKAGHPGHAEAAYVRALEADKKDVVAMSNLVRLYEAQGAHDKAGAYRKKVDEHRMRNPQLRLALAREAVEAGELDAAMDHLVYVTRKLDNDEAAFLLAVCHLELGHRKKAERWLARAEKAATTEPAKARYAAKLEALERESRRHR
jgi:tetratricopeptide (TPR) repeat protein